MPASARSALPPVAPRRLGPRRAVQVPLPAPAPPPPSAPGNRGGLRRRSSWPQHPCPLCAGPLIRAGGGLACPVCGYGVRRSA